MGSPGTVLTLVTATTGYPVTLDQVRAHLNLPHYDDDDYLEDIIIPGATEAFELATRRQLMLATYDYKLPCFWDGTLELPKPPLLSVTSITYYDTDNAAQTLATTVYGTVLLNGDSPFGGIYRKKGQSWPSLYGQDGAYEVVVRFTCGYSSSATVATQRAAVPVRAKQGVLLIASDSYESREPTVTGTIRSPNSTAFESILNQFAVPVLWQPQFMEAA